MVEMKRQELDLGLAANRQEEVKQGDGVGSARDGDPQPAHPREQIVPGDRLFNPRRKGLWIDRIH